MLVSVSLQMSSFCEILNFDIILYWWSLFLSLIEGSMIQMSLNFGPSGLIRQLQSNIVIK